jgi:DNA repair photolyase
MNIYRGCSHACLYCDSRSACYGIDDFDTVKAKKDALTLIERDLKKKKQKGVVATGAMSDPYNPGEEKEELTRGALKLLDVYGFGAAIATKSVLVARDIDLLKKITAKSPVIVKITITAADDGLAKKIEPHANTSSERFAALKTLADNGIYGGVLLMPVLPFITDTADNITAILHKAQESGAKFVYPYFGVTLRDKQRAYYLQKLTELFPGLREKYLRQYGNRYHCMSPAAKKLYALTGNFCSEWGLDHKMPDIVKSYKKGYGQLSLF